MIYFLSLTLNNVLYRYNLETVTFKGDNLNNLNGDVRAWFNDLHKLNIFGALIFEVNILIYVTICTHKTVANICVKILTAE